MAQLVDTLGPQGFGVAAHSSGGPYALACALVMSERITRVVLASCVVPLDDLPADLVDAGDDERHLVQLARSDPTRAAAVVAAAADWLLTELDRFLSVPRPEPDALLLQDPRVRDVRCFRS